MFGVSPTWLPGIARCQVQYLLPGVLIPSLADNGPTVQVVLQEDEQQPEHNDEGGGL